jgi:hypothetical protein
MKINCDIESRGCVVPSATSDTKKAETWISSLANKTLGLVYASAGTGLIAVSLDPVLRNFSDFKWRNCIAPQESLKAFEQCQLNVSGVAGGIFGLGIGCFALSKAQECFQTRAKDSEPTFLSQMGETIKKISYAVSGLRLISRAYAESDHTAWACFLTARASAFAMGAFRSESKDESAEKTKTLFDTVLATGKCVVGTGLLASSLYYLKPSDYLKLSPSSLLLYITTFTTSPGVGLSLIGSGLENKTMEQFGKRLFGLGFFAGAGVGILSRAPMAFSYPIGFLITELPDFQYAQIGLENMCSAISEDRKDKERKVN